MVWRGQEIQTMQNYNRYSLYILAAARVIVVATCRLNRNFPLVQIIQLFSTFFGLHTVCHVTVWGIIFTFPSSYLLSEVVNICKLKSCSTRETSQRRWRAPCFNSCCAGELRLHSEICEVPRKGIFQKTCWRCFPSSSARERLKLNPSPAWAVPSRQSS